jgi:hypothetical protein
MEQSKKCSKCGLYKSLKEFYKHKRYLDGYRSNCKDCYISSALKCYNYKKDIVSEKNYKRNRVLKQEIIDAYGSSCVCCGEIDFEFLTIDHINNNGKQHRQEIGKRNIYIWLKNHNFPKDNFQLLCWNCNMAKGHYGQCPHSKSFNIE